MGARSTGRRDLPALQHALQILAICDVMSGDRVVLNPDLRGFLALGYYGRYRLGSR